MKSRVLLTSGILTAGVLICVPMIGVAKEKGKEGKGNQVKTETHRCCFDVTCYVLPAVPLSDNDQKNLTEILKKSDASLYRIETYKGGRKGKPLGKLKVDDSRVAEFAEMAKAPDFTGWTVQIGDCHARSLIDVTHTTEFLRCCRMADLANKIDPILRKYRQK